MMPYRVECIAGEPKAIEERLNEYATEGWEVLTGQIIPARCNLTGQMAQAFFCVLRRKPAAEVLKAFTGRGNG